MAEWRAHRKQRRKPDGGSNPPATLNSKLGDADRKARPRCLFAGFYYVGSMYHGHA